jgi:Flp pilus assembly protein TadG
MSIAAHFSRFLRDRRANIGILAALLLVPSLVGVGSAIDYSRLISAEAGLDMAAHAAAAAAVTTGRSLLVADPTMPIANVQAAAISQATKAFAAQTPSSLQNSYTLTEVSIAQVGNTLSAKVSYTGAVSTSLLNMIGISRLPISGTTAANGPLASEIDDPNYILRETFDKNVTAALTTNSWDKFANYYNWQTTNLVEIQKKTNYAPVNGPTATYVGELDVYVNSSMSKKSHFPEAPMSSATGTTVASDMPPTTPSGSVDRRRRTWIGRPISMAATAPRTRRTGSACISTLPSTTWLRRRSVHPSIT